LKKKTLWKEEQTLLVQASKSLSNHRIQSRAAQESIPPAYVAWQAGTTTLVHTNSSTVASSNDTK